MKTIILKFHTTKEDQIIIRYVRKQFSSATRYAYNRILENVPQKDIENKIKELNNTELLDSWMRRCAFCKAKSTLESVKELNKTKDEEEKIDPKKINFGTKFMFYQRLKGKITKEEFKENRLMYINVQGELNQNGNRKFEFDLDNNKILFKYSKNIHIVLNIPKLRKNIEKELKYIQEHKLLYSVEINNTEMHIMFDETQIQKIESKFIKDRTLSIDMNPNYIGYSIFDHSGENQKLIKAQCYDLQELNKDLELKSNDPKKIYQNNKRKYEILQIVKEIIIQAKHFQVEKIVLEELNIKNKNHGKGKAFNRKVNNNWMRKLFTTKLNMLCNINSIKLCYVNAAYSSFIGNMQYNYFDPVNSSIEIGRRAKEQFVSGSRLYPTLSVKDQWKEYLTASNIKNWKSLYKKFENDHIRYRVSLDESLKFSRYSYKKKHINLYNFI